MQIKPNISWYIEMVDFIFDSNVNFVLFLFLFLFLNLWLLHKLLLLSAHPTSYYNLWTMPWQNERSIVCIMCCFLSLYSFSIELDVVFVFGNYFIIYNVSNGVYTSRDTSKTSHFSTKEAILSTFLFKEKAFSNRQISGFS